MLYPLYSDFVKDDETVSKKAWRIASTTPNPFGNIWGYDDQSLGDLGFATKKDCQQAIDCLAKHGYTTDESIRTLSDHEFARICLQNLAW